MFMTPVLDPMYTGLCHWSFGPGRTGPRTKISNRNFGPPDHFKQKKQSYPGNFGPVLQNILEINKCISE